MLDIPGGVDGCRLPAPGAVAPQGRIPDHALVSTPMPGEQQSQLFGCVGLSLVQFSKPVSKSSVGVPEYLRHLQGAGRQGMGSPLASPVAEILAGDLFSSMD